MSNWQTKQLSDVCLLDKKQGNYSGLPYVGLEHIESMTGRFIGDFSATEVKSSTFKFTKEHILYGRLRPYLNKVLLPSFDAGHCSTEIMPLKVNEEIQAKYLFYWLTSSEIVDKINDTCTGARMPRANMKEVMSFEIPLPPIPEQQRIVAILDQAFADIEKVRANAEQNLKNARELFDSYLQQVFSQRGEGWEVRPLESFSNIVNGFAFKSSDFSPNNKAKSIKITNVGVYNFVEESDSYLPQDYLDKYDSYKAYEGDIVIALTRTIISSGLKVAFVPPDYDASLINQRVAAVQVNEDIMPKKMLLAFLSTSIAIKYVKSNVSELMQPNLSIKDVKAFPVPVPPSGKKLAISKNISDIKNQADQLIGVYETKLKSLDELKKSLLQKAFSGELTKGEGRAA